MQHEHASSHDVHGGEHPAAPVDFWEERYAGAGPVWSGRVNATLAAVIEERALAPGRALDLGCGEGADAIWLAQRGWTVTGIDISATAIQRASAAAHAAGLDDDRVRFAATDLSSWKGADAGSFDLVTASFFHSPVELPRGEILRSAAKLVAPGGHLLLVTHAALPPWASGQDAHHRDELLTPEQEVAQLDLEDGEWTTVLAETRDRTAVAPSGDHAGETVELTDGVVLLRRRKARLA